MSEHAGPLGILYIALGVVVIGLSVPLFLGRIPMNRWFGVRLPEAYRSEANWREINRYGAKQLTAYGVYLIAAGAIVLAAPPPVPGVWFIAALAVPVAPVLPMLVLLLRRARR
jgi:hypothetical protein